MQPPATRRTLFAACILAIGAVAASPAGASPDGGADDGGLDAAVSVDASLADSGLDTEGGPYQTTADAAAVDDASESGDGALDATMGASSYVMDDGGQPPYTGGDIFQRLCVDNPNAVEFTYATVAAPYTQPAACKALHTDHAAARSCLCDNCFTLQQQCDALPGCQEIQKCGFDTGCTDPDSCYLIGGSCVTPINNWGTGSVSTALSQLLETCGSSHSCPTQ